MRGGEKRTERDRDGGREGREGRGIRWKGREKIKLEFFPLKLFL